MPRSILRSALIIGVSASLLLHAVTGVVMWIAAPGPMAEAADEPILVDFDVNEAPPPPEAEMPAEEEAAPPPAPAPPEPAAEAIAESEPAPVEPEPEPEPIAALDAAPPPPDAGQPVDAGVDDAAVEDAAVDDAAVDDAAVDDAAVEDAAVDDAAMLAGNAGDAGVQAAAAADAGAHDAGLLARTGSDGDAGASAVAAAGIDAGPGSGAASGEAGGDPARMGAGLGMPGTSDINLLAYLPPGDVVSVLVRFDRLRGWPWAAQAEDILAPMPDYRTLIGEREVAVSDLFDFIVISTPQPRDVTATTIVGRVRPGGPDMRGFINHPGAPVAWYTARGGAAGRRLPSPLVALGDPRMFLLPRPGWVVLAQPRHLGRLSEPAEGAIETAVASEADLPDWLARAPAIEEATGTATQHGPVLMVTVQGLLPPRWRAPFLGEIETPRRLTLAVEVARGGFYVRGAMLFDSEAQAERFIAAFGTAQAEATSAPLGKALLARFHLYHALNGLSFKRNGTKVAYATSISVADARGLLDRTAAQLRLFFGTQGGPQQRRPQPEPAPAPGRPRPPQQPRPQPAQPQPGPAQQPQQQPQPEPTPAQPEPEPAQPEPEPTPAQSPQQQPQPTPTPEPAQPQPEPVPP